MLAMKLDDNYNILKNLSKEEFNNILESKDCQEIFNDYTPEELSVLITLFYKNGDYINKLITYCDSLCDAISDDPVGCDACPYELINDNCEVSSCIYKLKNIFQ